MLVLRILVPVGVLFALVRDWPRMHSTGIGWAAVLGPRLCWRGSLGKVPATGVDKVMMQKKTVKPFVFCAIVTICLGILVVSLTFQTNGQSPGRNLTKRKNEIIRIIQERGGLDTILRRRITAARSAAELESRR
mgnify:FL=1